MNFMNQIQKNITEKGRLGCTAVKCALLSVMLDNEFDDAASVKNLMTIRYQKMKSKISQRSSINRIYVI
jgi:hypothetical protein